MSTFPIVKGQYSEPKFGKIDMADMTMNKYENDTSAAALVLFDNGKSSFEINSDKEFQIHFERHNAIRIFKQSAFPAAEIKIKLYKDGPVHEKLLELKVVTYNLEDGKIVKSKLDNDNIYTSETKYYSEVKFAFPKVKEGSVLELSYTIISDFMYNFRGWTFQSSYPTRWSQYRYDIPEYYSYRQSSKGYLNFDVNSKGRTQETFSYKSSADSKDLWDPSQGSQIKMETLKYYSTKGILAIKDVPAFMEEPNIDCLYNYLQSIEFELSSIQYPNSGIKEYTESWESVNKRVMENEDFGRLLTGNSFVKDTVTAICSGKTSETAKAISIYDYLLHRMKWDGSYRIWAMKGLKKPFSERVGNSSEINLLLTMMLQTAGLKANPVLFSTRDNGIALSSFPTISKFNSVLTSVNIDGKGYLVDATEPNCPFGVLPLNDINGTGRVLNQTGGDWAKLEPVCKYEVSSTYSLKIDQEGKFAGSITENNDGYAGILLRSKIRSESGRSEYFKKLQEKVKGLTINKYSVGAETDIYKPLIDTMNVDIEENSELVGNNIIFRPLLFEIVEKNPYTLEERKYPVNYNYPVSEHYTFIYTLPDHYVIESLPQSATLKTPDNSILISYNIKAEGNKITLIYNYEVNKTLFMPEDYKNVKAFYDQIVKKHAEQIILKRDS